MAADAWAPTATKAISRLRRDLESMRRSTNPQLAVSPSSASMLEWHFVLHSLPDDTPYHGGCYHGKIIFPPLYPNAPPALMMITPNGRLDINRKLCLSMTDFHPESWNPAWSVETILVGLLSFMVSVDEPSAYGAISESTERRRQLATDSWAFNARSSEFAELFPEFLDPPSSSSTAGAASPSAATEDLDTQPSPTQSIPALRESTGMEVANAAETETPRHVDEDEHDAAVECWICRDSSLAEPLIQPCACRGSMSGVHASCVEGWIRHHRQNAMNDVPPTCTVCNQPYQGSEQRPGPLQYARHMCCSCIKVLAWVTLRLLIFSVMLLCYLLGARTVVIEGHDPLPVAVRIALILTCLLFYTHKILVLVVSIPRNRLAPRHRFLRLFYLTSSYRLVTELFELATMVYVLGILFAIGALAVLYFLPFLVVYLVLAVRNLRHFHRVVRRRPQNQGLRQLVPSCLQYVWRHPRRVFNPFRGVPHVVLGLIALGCSVFRNPDHPQSALDLVLLFLFGVHSVYLTVGLFEHALIRRVRWRKGCSWGVATYVAMLTCIFTTAGPPSMLANVSLMWMALQVCLALTVNWASCVRRARVIRENIGVPRLDTHYRTWQNRHGTFVLGGTGGAAAAAQQEQRQQQPQHQIEQEAPAGPGNAV